MDSGQFQDMFFSKSDLGKIPSAKLGTEQKCTWDAKGFRFNKCNKVLGMPEAKQIELQIMRN